MTTSTYNDSKELSLVRSTSDPEILAQFADHSSKLIQIAVATNPAATADTLRKLAQAENVMIRARVAVHPNTPMDIVYASLEADSSHEEKVIRSLAARNPNLPVEYLAKLSESEDFAILIGVARNEKATTEMLSRIYEKAKARSNPQEREVTDGLLHNPNVHGSILEKFSNSEETYIRAIVAENISTPVNVLGFLAKDEDITVKTNACNNVSTSMFDAADFFRKHIERGEIKPTDEVGLALTARADKELKTLGYDEETLNGLTLAIKMKLFASSGE